MEKSSKNFCLATPDFVCHGREIALAADGVADELRLSDVIPSRLSPVWDRG